MTSLAARCRFLLAGFATTALLAAPSPAIAASAPADATGCPATPVAQPFAAWNDMSDYFLAPDGGLEQGGAGWTTRAGAAVVAGSEPFAVLAPSDRKSMRLPAGSAATTAPFCIRAEDRTMRFFANAPAAGSLRVEVLYTDARGIDRTMPIGNVAGSGAWAPSPVLPMVVNDLAADRGNAMSIRLRFAPHGFAAWSIDDVHVDPYRVK
ncbi:MAG: hypothetical protein QOJ35_1729 [Solirubrobacteraceae bacterium]|nr:hypothetical protein [Solirubrobacteraceae bacterium]